MSRIKRVAVTATAKALIHHLQEKHGPLMFHQSGGCCDGSAPMCYPMGDFMVSHQDVKLGNIEGCPFYMGVKQYEYWQHTQLILDVAPGPGGSDFSLEGPQGERFITRSRLFSNAERQVLQQELAEANP
ncbi:MAG: DUF779 domain-containing protein [Cyanobacteria bacterium J06627_28]